MPLWPQAAVLPARGGCEVLDDTERRRLITFGAHAERLKPKAVAIVCFCGLAPKVI